jgi:hypothetical protein
MKTKKRKIKEDNGMYINLEKLKKFKPKEHLIPRDPYTFHIDKLKNKDFIKGTCFGLISGGLIVGLIWLLSLM